MLDVITGIKDLTSANNVGKRKEPDNDKAKPIMLYELN